MGALASTVAMFAASFVAEVNFWAYSVLFGWVNGFFAGMAYQAPMHAVQLYFPDRKGSVSKVLLLGMAIGIGLYSYLTLYWASEGEICNLQTITWYLSACMFCHTCLAGILLSIPSTQIKSDQLRQLQFNLLNA